MSNKQKRVKVFDLEKLKKINPTTLKLWNKYKIDMSLRELSEQTINQYYYDLSVWWIYILENQGNVCITELDSDDIVEFLYYCKSNGNNSRRMKRRMSAIGAFYKFLRKKKIITENPMEFIDRPKKDTDIAPQTFLTDEQITSLKESLIDLIRKYSFKGKTHLALQYQCYALLSLSTMARVGAISNIEWNMIDYETRTINNVIEKEGYLVTLYFSQEVKEILLRLQQYRNDNNIEDYGYVFVTKNSNSKEDNLYHKADTTTIWRWCKRIGKLIDVPELHPHDFRHTGATLLKNRGMALEDISILLNHKSTDVTNKFYIKADKKAISSNKDKFGL